MCHRYLREPPRRSLLLLLNFPSSFPFGSCHREPFANPPSFHPSRYTGARPAHPRETFVRAKRSHRVCAKIDAIWANIRHTTSNPNRSRAPEKLLAISLVFFQPTSSLASSFFRFLFCFSSSAFFLFIFRQKLSESRI